MMSNTVGVMTVLDYRRVVTILHNTDKLQSLQNLMQSLMWDLPLVADEFGKNQFE